jgi:hypothetical protein
VLIPFKVRRLYAFTSGIIKVMSKVKDGMKVRIRAREATAEEAKNGQYAPYLGNATGTVMKVYSTKQIAVNLDLDSLHADVVTRHKKQQEAMQKRWLDSLSEEARNRLTPEEKAFRLNYVVLLPESDLLTGKSAEKTAAKQPEPEPAKTTAAPAKPEPKPTKANVTAKNMQAVVAMPAVEKPSKSDKKATAKPEKSASKPEKSSAKQPTAKPSAAKQTTAPKTTKSEAVKPVTGKPKSTPQAQGRDAGATKSETRNPKSADVPTPKRPTLADLEAQEEQYLKSKKKRS